MKPRAPQTWGALTFYTGYTVSMKKWVVIDKKVGQTPLQAIEAFKKWYPGYSEAKMAYAGRLDPMASGKLLVLIGEECKVQEKYHALDKEYKVEILLGVKSDSGDVLGLIQSCPELEIPRHTVIRTIKKMRGLFAVPYPKFSSKTVNGKPLFQWALENKLNEITIPTQEGYIYKIRIDTISRLSGDEIVKTAREKIRSLPTVTEKSKALGADFRRESVEATWEEFLAHNNSREFLLINIMCICSSGTYMRSLAEVIGEKLGTGALAYSIHRTEIGKQFWLPCGLSFWRKKF